MKTIKYIKNNTIIILLLSIILVGCEREISDEAVLATFPKTAEVFTDAPVNLTDEFFISFDPAGGANTEGFGTDDNIAYEGSSSIRIDVPAADDPNGGFIGGIFRDRGEGRDLTSYDALTFWAKGSSTGTLGEVGFGTDFLGGQFPVSRSNIQLTTGWKKYIVPIPDPSKLTQVKGMFLFSAGGLDVLDNIPNGNEIGWTIWIDEIKFEKLGTIGQPQPIIYNGQDVTVNVFNGSQVYLNDLRHSFNLGTGETVLVNPSYNYFEFSSSNSAVVGATPMDIKLDASGRPFVEVLSQGQARITAKIRGIQALGSINVNSAGTFPQPMTPPVRNPNDVISLYSNAYTNRSVDTFRADFGSTGFEFAQVAGNDVLSYNNLDFVGIQMTTTPVDATNMNFLHLDLFTTSSNTTFKVEIRDRGANGELNTNQFTGQPIGDDRQKDYFVPTTNMTPGQWISIDIPLDAGLANQKNNIAQIVFVGDIGSFFVDNLYFYR